MAEPASERGMCQEADMNNLLDLTSNLEFALSKEQKSKVTNILTQVAELSDLEKLMLYLKLPTHVADEPPKQPMSERTLTAIKWIRSQYVEDDRVCLLKQDVYDDYKERCEAARNNPISSYDFAKMMKFVFPKVFQRRLGTRGRQRYYYAGLKSKENSGSACQAEKLSTSPDKDEDDLYTVSCQLVCDWASQLLGRQFFDVQNLSDYLVSIGVSCGKAATKLTQMSGNADMDPERKSPTTRHQDAQLLVQRKLQHNEVIREQKQKLAQQQKQQREKEALAQKRFNTIVYRGDQKSTTVVSMVPRGRSQPCLLSFQQYTNNSKSCSTDEKREVSQAVNRATVDAPPATHSLVMPLPTTLQALRTANTGVHCMKSSKTSVSARETGPSQVKRCQSTSVVEKHSTHLASCAIDLLSQTPEPPPSSADNHVSTDKHIPQHHHTIKMEVSTLPLESKLTPKSSSSLSLPPVSTASFKLSKPMDSPSSQKSACGLIMPQHPKRNGDSISPDCGSYTKRRCITSLGVTKQQSLDVDMARNKFLEDEVNRTRPFSCPISVDDSLYDSGIERGDSLLNPLSVGTKSSEIGGRESLKSIDEQKYGDTVRAKYRVEPTTSYKTESEKGKNTESQQKKSSSLVHFVKKPTVITRPVSVVNTASSQSDLSQADSHGDNKPKEGQSGKSSYSILNSLLSSSCDMLPESVTASESPIVQASTLPSPYMSSESSPSTLLSSPIRQVTNSPHLSENIGILSSSSCRSAFMPVTSHKSMAAVVRKESDNVSNAPTVPTSQSPLAGDKSAHGLPNQGQSTLISTHSACRNERTFPRSDNNKQLSGFSSVRSVKHNFLNTLSSSSSSSSSTLCRSGESTCSSGESSFATPVPISVTEKSEVSLRSAPAVPVLTDVVPVSVSSAPSTSTAQPCKSSPTKRSNTPGQVSSPNQGIHIPQTRNTTTSPLTQPKRASRNRFTPIRPKLGNGASTPSPQKLAGGSTTPSPQKVDIRPASSILRNAQDLLVNLASNYHGEVKLQMPADLLGLSPVGKSKSADVLVTIGPSTGNTQKNFQSGKSTDVNLQSWPPVITTASTQKEITVVVEPVSQVTCQSSVSQVPALCPISASTSVLSSIPHSSVSLITPSICSSQSPNRPLLTSSTVLPGQLQHVPLALTPAGSETPLIIVPSPAISGQVTVPTTVDNLNQPIIVEDSKGNKYSLDHKSGSMISPQDLQKLLGTSQATVTPDSQQSGITTSSGLVQISGIKGHVVGPDANGQTYLLVPNSEPIVSTSSATTFSFIPQQSSPTLSTTVTHSATRSPVVSTAAAAGPGIIQPRATSSSALLTELSQLVSTGQQSVSGQGLIQHNSGSAFHKCASSGHKKEETTAIDKTVGLIIQVPCSTAGQVDHRKEQSLSQDSEEMNSKAIVTKCSESDVNRSRSRTGIETPDPIKSQGLRKRKASKSSSDEHEDKKRISSAKEGKEVDDDVFIVTVEDSNVTDSGEKCVPVSEMGSKKQSMKSAPVLENASHKRDNTSGPKPVLPAVAPDVTDPETLLSIIEGSKTMTVKEAVQVLNAAQARQSKEGRLVRGKGKGEELRLERNLSGDLASGLSQSDTDLSRMDIHTDRSKWPKDDTKFAQRPHSARCTSTSPNILDSALHQAANPSSTGNTADKVSVKVQRTGKRHISLNLESLESDALLDLEPALDHRLVVDGRDTQAAQSDGKTSVGVAAKSAKSTVSAPKSDKTVESKCKSKQSKQVLASSNRTLSACQMLHYKRQLDRICSHVSGKEQIPSSTDESPDNTENLSVLTSESRQTQKPQQHEGKKKQTRSLEGPRSMSCVQDILRNEIDLDRSVFGQEVSSRVLYSSSQRNRASDHPFLVQRLLANRPVQQILVTGDVNCQSQSDRTCEENSTLASCQSEETAGTKSHHNDSDLPGDIVDFITESMSSRNLYHSRSYMENSLNSLLADLSRHGQGNRDQASSQREQSSTVLRSMSVPNTIPDSRRFFEGSVPQLGDRLLKELQESIHISSQSQVADQSDIDILNELSKHRLGSQNSSDTTQTSTSNKEGFHENADFVSQKYVTPSDNGSMTSATFLSPLGPARLTRRSSAERSVLADRSSAKTPVDFAGTKCNTDRPPSRMKTPVDRSQSKTPVERVHTVTLSKATVDRSGRKTPRNRSPSLMEASHIRDPTTAAMLQQPVKEREHQRLAVNRALVQSPTDKPLGPLKTEKQLYPSSVDNLLHQSSVERSLSQTPVSDGGYNSVSQTPISDPGSSSVSPSPIMMATPGLYGECGRRDLISPATIFMPLRSDSVMSVMHSGRSYDGTESTGIADMTGCGIRAGYSTLPTNGSDNPRDTVGDKESKLLYAGDGLAPSESSLFQDAIDGTLFQASLDKDRLDCDIIRDAGSTDFTDTTSLLDFEKIMSTQLTCIPTPPSSPSSSPRHPLEPTQSPVPFSYLSSHAGGGTDLFAISAHRSANLSAVTVTTVSFVSAQSDHRSHLTSTSPAVTGSGYSSPTLPSNSSASPLATGYSFSSPHQYNPHPSPPFTPSSHLCLSSPRCPTPCSHRSLMSPRCATPCSDSNSAPNKFMPIQTSGILAVPPASSQTYIQPIKPVVTLASMASQNCHPSSAPVRSHQPLSSHRTNQRNTDMTAYLSDFENVSRQAQTETNVNSFMKTDVSHTILAQSMDNGSLSSTAEISSDRDMFHFNATSKAQHSKGKEAKGSRSTQPALVLSLTGSIGTVSRQGMKSGWSKELAGLSSSSTQIQSINEQDIPSSFSSSYNQNQSSLSSLSLSSSSFPTQDTAAHLCTELLPTYEEAVSLLTGQSSHLLSQQDTEGQPPTVKVERGQGSPKSGFNQQQGYSLPKLLQGAHRSMLTLDGTNMNVGSKPGGPFHSKTDLKRDNFQLAGGKAMSKPNVQAIQGGVPLKSNKPMVSEGNTSIYPFSHQLALLSGRSRSGSSEHHDMPSSDRQQTGQLSQPLCPASSEGNSVQSTRKQSLSSMLNTHPLDTGQPFSAASICPDNTMTSKAFKTTSELPTAYYAGTAPNVDLTRTSLVAPQTDSTATLHNAGHTRELGRSTSTDIHSHLVSFNSHLQHEKRPGDPSPAPDDLEETLDVLKSLDSHYFPPDDDSNSSGLENLTFDKKTSGFG